MNSPNSEQKAAHSFFDKEKVVNEYDPKDQTVNK